MNRLSFDTREAAQAKAEAIHEWLTANDSAYAASVAAGQTLRWAEPLQDLDEEGQPVSSQWHIFVDARCEGALK